MAKGRFLDWMERHLSPAFREAADFIEEHIGINVFKYLPLLLFWYWLIIVSLEKLVKSNLIFSFIAAIFVTFLVVGRDLHKRYKQRQQEKHTVLKKDQPTNQDTHL